MGGHSLLRRRFVLVAPRRQGKTARIGEKEFDLIDRTRSEGALC